MATIARIAVTRGMFGVAWLRAFLDATGYLHPDALVAELFPGGAVGGGERAEAKTEPWYDNLFA